jgi:hypothetical protein
VVKDNLGSCESGKIYSSVDPIIGSQVKEANVVAMRENANRENKEGEKGTPNEQG